MSALLEVIISTPEGQVAEASGVAGISSVLATADVETHGIECHVFIYGSAAECLTMLDELIDYVDAVIPGFRHRLVDQLAKTESQTRPYIRAG